MKHRFLPLQNWDSATATSVSFRTLDRTVMKAVGRMAEHARALPRMTGMLAIVGTILCIAQSASAEGLQVRIFNATAEEWNTTSVLIMGETEMVVVCGQSMKSSAERLAGEIRATGLRLKAVFLTHAHADHSQGASVILKHFPEARFIATPDVAARQRARIPRDDIIARAIPRPQGCRAVRPRGGSCRDHTRDRRRDRRAVDRTVWRRRDRSPRRTPHGAVYSVPPYTHSERHCLQQRARPRGRLDAGKPCEMGGATRRVDEPGLRSRRPGTSARRLSVDSGRGSDPHSGLRDRLR